jgi:hypothetical protein
MLDYGHRIGQDYGHRTGQGRGAELDSGKSLRDRELNPEELDLEMAELLPRRDTLGVPVVTVNMVFEPVITINTGVAVATQVLSTDSSNGAWVLQFVHVAT